MNIISNILIFTLLFAGWCEFLYQTESLRHIHAFEIQRTAANDTLPVPAQSKTRNLSPHSAKLRAEIIKFDSDTQGPLLYLKVKEILGYGASTPVLSSGQVLAVNTNTYFMTSNRSTDWIQSGKTAVVLVSHAVSMEMNSDSKSTSWSVVEMKEYSQPQK